MITEDRKNLPPMVPFLFAFAEPLPESPLLLLRYDASRQISQVSIAGTWIDGPDAPGPLPASTRFTKVTHETTDDA